MSDSLNEGNDYLTGLWQRRLGRLQSRHQRRSLPEPIPADIIDVSHNDYLRLIPELSKRQSALPAGSGGSRLLGGGHPIYEAAEQAFSEFKWQDDSTSACLLLNSGFAANEAVISCLNLPDVGFFYDAFCHASLIDGLKLAGIPPARKTAFRHQDLDHLKELLRASPHAANVVLIESVYSMDGDLADIGAVLALCRAHRGVAVIDEAHALGVFGSQGQGLVPQAVAAAGMKADEVITVNPCGKGMASAGAFITGPDSLRDYAINTARSFIYTTALPPRQVDLLMSAIELVAASADRRQHLAELTALVRGELAGVFGSSALGHGALGGGQESPIIPVLCGSGRASVGLAEHLFAAGFYARPIRFPTVAKGSERVRISLNAGLSLEQGRRLVTAVRQYFSGVRLA